MRDPGALDVFLVVLSIPKPVTALICGENVGHGLRELTLFQPRVHLQLNQVFLCVSAFENCVR